MSGQHVKTEPLTLPGRIALAAIISVLLAGAATMLLVALAARSHPEPSPPSQPVVRVVNASLTGEQG